MRIFRIVEYAVYFISTVQNRISEVYFLPTSRYSFFFFFVLFLYYTPFCRVVREHPFQLYTFNVTLNEISHLQLITKDFPERKKRNLILLLLQNEKAETKLVFNTKLCNIDELEYIWSIIFLSKPYIYFFISVFNSDGKR